MPRYESDILRLIDQGLNDSAIAAQLGCSRPTVAYYRQKHGRVQPRGKALHLANAQKAGFPDVASAIRAWAAEGLTNNAIGARLGCYGPQVSLYIRELGGVPRPAGRGRVKR